MARGSFNALLSCIPELVAEEEIRTRQSAADLTPARVKQLVYQLTGSMEQAERAEAKRWLEMTRAESQNLPVITPPPA